MVAKGMHGPKEYIPCCTVVGEQRIMTRADLMKCSPSGTVLTGPDRYRQWSFIGFMLTLRGSVFGEIWIWCLLYGMIAAAVWACDKYWGSIVIANDAHKLFIIPVAFLLAFRSNTAYARFWEGRAHFGTFNFGIRECCRRAHTYIHGHDEGPRLARRNIMRLLMVMAISVRENLRKRSMGQEAVEKNLKQVAPYLTPKEHEEYSNVVKNRPLLVMSWIGKFVHQAYIDQYIQDPTGQVLMSFDGNVSALLEGWMGMNKVCYQPIPFPYIHTLHWFLMIWLSTLPLVLVKDLHAWVILVMPLIAGALLAIEEVSEEIEDPFGDDLNDLPTENFEIGLIRDAGMVVNEHTGPMSMRCKAETYLEPVGPFQPIVDYTPAGESALQARLYGASKVPQMTGVVVVPDGGSPGEKSGLEPDASQALVFLNQSQARSNPGKERPVSIKNFGSTRKSSKKKREKGVQDGGMPIA